MSQIFFSNQILCMFKLWKRLLKSRPETFGELVLKKESKHKTKIQGHSLPLLCHERLWCYSNANYRVEVGALAWSCDHAGAPKSILTQGDLEFGALAWSYLKSINDHARAPRSRSPWVSMDFGAPEWSDFLIYPILSFMNNDHAWAPRSILCTVVWKLVPS